MEPEIVRREHLYLTIDQGGHASRALVFDYRGQCVASAVVDVQEQTPQPGWVEQDPGQLVRSIQQAVQQVLAELGDQTARIHCAGMATQRSSIVCWNRETGEALSPVISWQDRRAHERVQAMEIQREKIHTLTGLYLSAHYGASKLRWCLEQLPAVATARETGALAFGPLASYLAWQLLEEHPLKVDPANASRTLLWGLLKGDWEAELLRLFDIPLEALPEVVPSLHDYGTLVAGGRRIPLKLLNGDQSAAIFAYGEVQPETAYINVGTGAFVSRPMGHLPRQQRRLLTSIVMDDGREGTYVLEGTVNGAGSALEWLEQELGLQDLFAQLPHWLGKCDEVPLFMNGISGLAAPYWIPDFPVMFEGEGDDAQKAVAVVESIIFLLFVNMSEMHKLSSPPQSVQITGGLSRLDGMCQRLADLGGMPVYRPVSFEATARGTAWLLAGCPAEWPEPGMGNWFKPKANPGIHRRFEKWEQAMLDHMRSHTA